MRALTEDDGPAVVALLDEGFPGRGRAFWQAAWARLLRHGDHAETGYPPGFALLDGERPVGLALTLPEWRRRPDGSRRRLVNICCWTVQPAYRWRAGFLLRNLLADPANVYTDLTPTPALQAMLPRLGMLPVNAGIALHPVPLLALRPARRARLRALGRDEPWDGAGPPRRRLEAHRVLGCEPLVLEDDEAPPQLVVVMRTRLRGLPAAQLVYADDRARLLRHGGALGRALLRLGSAVFVCDTPLAANGPTHVFRPRERWFARGDDFSNRTDVLGSELCVLHAPAALRAAA